MCVEEWQDCKAVGGVRGDVEEWQGSKVFEGVRRGVETWEGGGHFGTSAEGCGGVGGLQSFWHECGEAWRDGAVEVVGGVGRSARGTDPRSEVGRKDRVGVGREDCGGDTRSGEDCGGVQRNWRGGGWEGCGGVVRHGRLVKVLGGVPDGSGGFQRGVEE